MSATSAILFDMDGVLASVGSSYRQAIIQTAARFGVTVTQEDIAVEKKRGNSNNDWILSKRLIDARIVDNKPNLEQVTEVFEELYQGTQTTPGLCETESLIPSKGLLMELHKRCSGVVAVVTGRPRKDCEKFLSTHGLTDLFPICVCMEDAPPKPDPTPLLIACERLGVPPSSCIMIGDTPDDIRAAVAAGALPFGVYTPEEEAKLTLGIVTQEQSMYPSMMDCGAARMMHAGLGEMLDVTFIPIKNSPRRKGTVSRSTKETSIVATVVRILEFCNTIIVRRFAYTKSNDLDAIYNLGS